MTSRLVAAFTYLLLLLVSAGLIVYGVSTYVTLTRGVESRSAQSAPPMIGTNVALEQYKSDSELQQALQLVTAAHLVIVRQHFPWRDIEKTQGQLDWSKWDRIVSQLTASHLQILAVLDTAPAWAQRDYERDLLNAPPDNFDNYAAFASAFAKRYANQIHYFEIWDEPNVHPGWGRRNADPVEYGRLLHAAASQIRANALGAKIVLAGLGMNTETQRPHPDYSDILFLRGLYEAGLQSDFDVVAAKPYGMWTGPEDRRVSPDLLNFSRVILLRDEMKQHGDVNKPLLAVEMGWNALPVDWEGLPSPWGTDREDVQAGRLARALTRVQTEWPWMAGLFPQILQPNAAPNDPKWGFAVVTREFQPRAFYAALAQSTLDSPLGPPARGFPFWPITFLGVAAAVSAWRASRLVPWAPLGSSWRSLRRSFTSLPELVQLGILAAGVAAFYLSPSVALNFVLLALLIPLFALRLDLGLTILAFTIPFYLYPKTLFGGFNLSLVEVMALVSTVAWIWSSTLSAAGNPARPAITYRELIKRFTSLDWAILVFVFLGAISTRIAGNGGVATREFRVIVIEPALLYFLLRVSHLYRRQLLTIVNALLAAGAVICVVGLFQIVGGDVIAAEGMLRVHGVWESPNNAALFLGRLLPLALALALGSPSARSRITYGGLTLFLGVTIYLTFSFGGLFIGVPASVLFIGLAWLTSSHIRPRVALLTGLALFVIAIAVIVPLTGTQRFQTLLQTGTGTGFFRIAVWESAIQMIRDHPVFGVGLDNFLYEYPKYILPEAWREPNLSHPHNVLLDFWVRLGIFGAAVLVWIEIEFFRSGWRVFRTGESPFARALALGLMGSMIDFLAHGMIDAAYFVVDLAFVFMLTVGLMACLAYATPHEEARNVYPAEY